MFRLESELLCSVKHANVLRGIHYGVAQVVEGACAERTTKQSSCTANGPFVVQKVKMRKVLYTATELAQEFDLNDYLEITQGFSEFHALQLFLQLMKGIKAIHDAGFANRDIKVSNILLDSKFNLKISDLGLAAPIAGCTCKCERHDIESASCQQIGRLFSIAGTEGQLAPEIHRHVGSPYVQGGYHGQAVDVFNAGIVLFNLLFATGPFYNAAPDDFYYGHLARNEGRKFWTK